MTNTTLIFTNPGEIDIRGAYIAGMSAKDTEAAIGYFGTGLKYAIAQVLAHGGAITIYSGLTCHEFSAVDVEFRGQSHKQIMMKTTHAGVLGDTCEPDFTPLGFTTGYGRKWQAWQIFRELYANALDEAGTVARGGRDLPLPIAPDRTVIVVSGWEDLAFQYHHRDEIILPPNLHVDAEDDNLSVANHSSEYIYYKGVRVAARACSLQWNFKQGLTLTEDRTIEAGTWEVSDKICNFVTHCTNESLIRAILTPGKMSFEEACLGWFNAPKDPAYCSEAFANVATDLYRMDPIKHKDYEALALSCCPQLREARRVVLTHLQTKMLERAKTLVARMGYEYEVANLPITVENLGGKTLGLYRDGAIILSPLTFDQGTKQVVSTLYEECLHAKLGYRDCTYEMQTHLFNTIIGLWEELMDEPC